MGALSGTNSSTLLGAYSGTGLNTFQIGALGANTTFAGAILDGGGAVGGTATGAAYLQKVGGGMLTLSGSNSYSGNTAITQGTLQVGAAAPSPTARAKGT